MKVDLDAGRHECIDPATSKKIKPSKFQTDCEEYFAFDLDVFCDHIYQEICARNERPYWMAKKQRQHSKKKKNSPRKSTARSSKRKEEGR